MLTLKQLRYLWSAYTSLPPSSTPSPFFCTLCNTVIRKLPLYLSSSQSSPFIFLSLKSSSPARTLKGLSSQAVVVFSPMLLILLSLELGWLSFLIFLVTSRPLFLPVSSQTSDFFWSWYQQITHCPDLFQLSNQHLRPLFFISWRFYHTIHPITTFVIIFYFTIHSDNPVNILSLARIWSSLYISCPLSWGMG